MNLASVDWQQLVFYLILISFLLSAIFSRSGIRIAQVLKYLSYWLLIALVILFIYSYRFDFANFKNRILGELFPSMAVVSGEQIVVNISSDGHFYINTKINGVAVRFMVDTGASDIVLSLQDARRVGIDLKRLNFNRIYHTANGKIAGAMVEVRDFTISNVEFHDVEVSVNKAEMSTSLLGMSFLRRFSKYEFYQDRLILTR